MAPRTKAVEGTPNEIKLAQAILNHKTKIVAQGEALAKVQAELTEVKAMAADLLLLTKSTAKPAPSWYRPWMGGLALGLVLVVLLGMTVSAKHEAARASAWIAKADSQAVCTKMTIDSLVAARPAEATRAVVRENKRRGLTASGHPVQNFGVADAGATANPGATPAAVPAGTPAVGGQ